MSSSENLITFPFENGVDYFNVVIEFEIDTIDIDIGNKQELCPTKPMPMLKDIFIYDIEDKNVTNNVRRQEPELFEEILGEACLHLDNLTENN